MEKFPVKKVSSFRFPVRTHNKLCQGCEFNNLSYQYTPYRKLFLLETGNSSHWKLETSSHWKLLAEHSSPPGTRQFPHEDLHYTILTIVNYCKYKNLRKYRLRHSPCKLNDIHPDSTIGLTELTIMNNELKNREDRGRVEVSAEECKGCGLCIEACPPHVLELSERLNGHGYHPAAYLGSGCTGCGICFYTCPEPGALTVFTLQAA